MSAAKLSLERKTWTHRRADEIVLQVWRRIANAGPKGIGPGELRTRMNDMAEDAMKLHLQELRRKGHIRFNGATRHGCWIATSKLPLTEGVPVWMRPADDQADDPDGEPPVEPVAGSHLLQAAKVVAAAKDKVANSVFDIADKLPAFGVDIDAVHMPAKHLQALADAAPPAAPTDAARPEPEPEPEPVPEPAAPATAPAAANGRPLLPVFALQSDGTLAGTLETGRVLYLSPRDTRHLFAYLDRLMAIGQGSLSEAAS